MISSVSSHCQWRLISSSSSFFSFCSLVLLFSFFGPDLHCFSFYVSCEFSCIADRNVDCCLMIMINCISNIYFLLLFSFIYVFIFFLFCRGLEIIFLFIFIGYISWMIMRRLTSSRGEIISIC